MTKLEVPAASGGIANRGLELLIVDPAVGQAHVLLDGRRADVEVVHLAPGGRGLEQVAGHLAGRRGIIALHVLSHGEPGALLLAGERIDLAGLAARSGVLADIADSLAADARVVLYGCSVAAGPAGRGLLDYLEGSFGVAVAASEAPVGAAALGGGWALRGRGNAPVETAFTPAARAAYAGLLANLTGTAGNDTLTGTSSADTITGLDGNDLLSGIGGNDILYGGDGLDTLYGGDGNDFIYASTGNDALYGEAGNDGLSGWDGADSIFGGIGNDTVIGGDGADTLSGGDGNDLVWGQNGADLMYGGDGNDGMSGGDGDDVLYGGGGADTLSGAAGADLLSGGAGNDALYGGAGDDTLVGGDGNDTFRESAANFNNDTISDFGTSDSIIVTGTDLSALNGTNASGTIDLGGGSSLTLTGISSASGTFAASFSGGNTTITLTAPSGGGGGGGSDGGGSSSDLVVTDSDSNTTGGDRTITNNTGSSGSAAIVQNTGNNNNVVTATLPPSVSITSDGPSTAQSGSTASDTLINAIDVRNTSGETGSISGAQGFLNSLSSTTPLDVRTIVPTVTSGIATDDPIVITGSSNGTQTEAFVIDMRTITGKTLQVNNIEFVSVMGNATVTGGAGNNYAVGDDNAQFMSLGVGDDTLYGGGGDDTIGSADGNDVLKGEAGADKVIGGAGNDTLFGGTEADVAYGNLDADLLYGNQANDTLYGGQNGDTVFGGQDADVAYGNLGDDVLYGNFGGDTLYGGQGNDALYGGQSNTGTDLLVGGEGNDTLNGGEGADSLTGGGGTDLFVVGSSGGNDTVTDFDGSGGDRAQIASNANGTAIDSFSELQAAASNTDDGGVLIALGTGNSLKLMGVSTSQLQSDWFVFT
jgi:Ca2+-binding RTX toxin-like protein